VYAGNGFYANWADPEPVVEPPVEEPAAAGYDEESPKKWYIIHTYSGFENKVAESLKIRADAFGFADKIGQVLIPTEEVVELRNGKKVTSKRLATAAAFRSGLTTSDWFNTSAFVQPIASFGNLGRNI